MKRKAGTLLIVLLIINSSSVWSQPVSKAKNDWPIVTRQKDQLLEGTKVFRFFGLAAPNIQQNESQIRPDFSNRFPDEFEIRDLLGGLQRVGARATRTFSLSVFSPQDNGLPVYISARRTYNEEAFKCLDRILALAPAYDIRLIIPIIASQSFGGIRGVDEFSALAGKPQGSFWTDEEVKADFKHFIEFLVNRRNTITGIRYKDDPAILCWQLGNEFGSYAGDRKLSYEEWTPRIQQWCVEMAAYIKLVDPNHLLMEAGGVDREAMLQNPHIDVISDHLYEYWNRMGGKSWDLAPLALASWDQCKGRKPLMIDEFGLGGTENLQKLMDAIQSSGISGGLLWSIRGHRRDGGWYYHNEGGTPVNSYHVPGFANGFEYEETRMLDLLRAYAYSIRGKAMPAMQLPEQVPVLFSQNGGLTWRGATGAAYYQLERASSVQGPFSMVATGLHDAVIADVKSFEYTQAASFPQVLYHDAYARPGEAYYYRVRGCNTAGCTPWSQVINVKY